MKDSSLENLKNCLCQKLGSLPSRDECERLQADIDAATFKATVEDSDDLYPFEAERKYIAEHNGHEN